MEESKEMSEFQTRCFRFVEVVNLMPDQKSSIFAQLAGNPKAKMIEESRADIVSAECSACRMQISNSLHQNGVDAVFKNPIELIAKALKSD